MGEIIKLWRCELQHVCECGSDWVYEVPRTRMCARAHWKRSSFGINFFFVASRARWFIRFYSRKNRNCLTTGNLCIVRSVESKVSTLRKPSVEIFDSPVNSAQYQIGCLLQFRFFLEYICLYESASLMEISLSPMLFFNFKTRIVQARTLHN